MDMHKLSKLSILTEAPGDGPVTPTDLGNENNDIGAVDEEDFSENIPTNGEDLVSDLANDFGGNDDEEENGTADDFGDPNEEPMEDGEPIKQEELQGIKILTSLSDTEYRLNNIKLINKFRELYKNVNNLLNNNINNIVAKTNIQTKVVHYVVNNLSSMLEDIDNYILYKISGTTYEDNMVSYLTFLKRYRVAMQLIQIAMKEKENSNEEK